MFKKIILASLFVSQSVFASHIMSKHVTSGLVAPEFSFVKDCRFINDGSVRITTKMGTAAPRTTVRHISRARVNRIKTLVKRAHSGRIVEVGATCDGGDNLLYGFISGHRVILDENFDCGRHRVNQSSATPSLSAIATNDCGF